MATNNIWDNQIAAANSVITLNSGTNAINISTDASATTVSIATGGAVKTATFGSTNTTSPTVIKSGTGNIVHNSGLTIDSSGRMFNTVQPCFLASQTGDQTNQTGEGTVYTVTFTDTKFDQGSNFSSPNFTAPVTGRYFFIVTVQVNGLTSSTTTGQLSLVVAGTSAATYRLVRGNFRAIADGGTVCGISGSCIVTMTATDTAHVTLTVSGGTKTVGVNGETGLSAVSPAFSGFLLC